MNSKPLNNLIKLDNLQKKTCRFCLEDDLKNNLIVTCLCSGTSKYVHRECIDRWRSVKGMDSNIFYQCQQCKFKYKIKKIKNSREKINKGCLYVVENPLKFIFVNLNYLYFIFLTLIFYDNKYNHFIFDNYYAKNYTTMFNHVNDSNNDVNKYKKYIYIISYNIYLIPWIIFGFTQIFIRSNSKLYIEKYRLYIKKYGFNIILILLLSFSLTPIFCNLIIVLLFYNLVRFHYQIYLDYEKVLEYIIVDIRQNQKKNHK